MNREELKRQRDAVARHLAWLDEQLATTGEEKNPLAPPEDHPPIFDQTQASEEVAPPAKKTEETTETNPRARPTSLEEPKAPNLTSEPDLTTIHRETRSGCLLWSLLLAALFIGSLILIYIFYPDWDEEDYERFRQRYGQEEGQIDNS